MTDARRIGPDAVRRRQLLLLGGLVGLVVVAVFVSVAITRSHGPDTRPARQGATQILAPGAQVDPRDAWRGQADAQLKGIEQKSREIERRNAELETQNKAMLERLKKLEEARLTPLPPPPLPAPAARANFGPDRAASAPAQAGTIAHLPPPPAPRAAATLQRQTPGMPAGPAASGIVSIAVSGNASAKAGSAASTAKGAAAPVRDTRRYLPSGSFTRAVLLGGLDAPTGGQAQRNPQPVLLRLVDHSVLPNRFRARTKACFVVAAGFGDVSSERAYIRTESLSCVARDGSAIDVPIRGYIAGEDGKAGMRGRLVSKQGQILANALLAGIAGGIGSAFQQNATTLSVSPLGTTTSVDPGRQLETGLGSGVGRALDRLAQYYINLAEKVFPVIEVDAGRTVDVILTQGVTLQEPLAGDADRATFPQLAARAHRLRSPTDD